MQCSLCSKIAHRVANGKGFCYPDHIEEAFAAMKIESRNVQSASALNDFNITKDTNRVRKSKVYMDGRTPQFHF